MTDLIKKVIEITGCDHCPLGYKIGCPVRNDAAPFYIPKECPIKDHDNTRASDHVDVSTAIDIVGKELRWHTENKGKHTRGPIWEDGFIDAIVHIHNVLADANANG